MLETLKSLAEIASGIGSALAVLATGGWFIYTSQFKRRLQFDLEFQVIPLQNNPQFRIAEIKFVLENKGFVEHKLWNLTVSLHTLASEENLTTKSDDGKIDFKRRILWRAQLVPKKIGYYFVRPGVRQIFTHIVAIPADVSVIRIISSFGYKRKDEYPHEACRVFSISDSSSKTKATLNPSTEK